MEEESILKAIDIIFEALDKSDIKQQDKMELMLNLHHFLINYEKTTKIKVNKKINMIENDSKIVRQYYCEKSHKNVFTF